eukprot:GHVN01074860.1.p1 GENE.GHVN01074860.1~~GHVN01074860.1.p1  ORF type:complete len:281 (+),score=36.82 GHVN01074860.1:219-1061(+)
MIGVSEEAAPRRLGEVAGIPTWGFVLICVLGGLALLAVLIFWLVYMKRQEEERLRRQLEMKVYRHEKKKAERMASKMQRQAVGCYLFTKHRSVFASIQDNEYRKFYDQGQPYDEQGGQPQPLGQPSPQPQPQGVQMGPEMYVSYTPTDQMGMAMPFGQPTPMGQPQGYGMGFGAAGGTYQETDSTYHPTGAVDPYGYGPEQGYGAAPAPPSPPPPPRRGRSRRARSTERDGKDDGDSYRIRRANSYSDLPEGPAPVPPPGFVAVPMVMEPRRGEKDQGRH